MISDDKKRLESVLENAREAFWISVAEQYPEIKSGDFSPSDTLAFEEMTEKYVKVWLDGNE